MTQLFFGPDGTPLSEPEDVRQFLGKPNLHWKERFSAFETAQSWFAAQDLPPAIRAILQTDPAYVDAQLQKACFEVQTQLDNTGRGPSQTDVLAFLQTRFGIIVLGVEGKVNEPFGQFISDWNNYSPGKLRRLAGLIERLKLQASQAVGGIRYQLLHRTVATLLEAEEAHAAEAVMLIQSFSPDDVRTGFVDFQNFATALGVPIAAPGVLSPPISLPPIRLRLGWTINNMHGNPI
jgi:hypothetical protein